MLEAAHRGGARYWSGRFDGTREGAGHRGRPSDQHRSTARKSRIDGSLALFVAGRHESLANTVTLVREVGPPSSESAKTSCVRCRLDEQP